MITRPFAQQDKSEPIPKYNLEHDGILLMLLFG